MSVTATAPSGRTATPIGLLKMAVAALPVANEVKPIWPAKSPTTPSRPMPPRAMARTWLRPWSATRTRPSRARATPKGARKACGEISAVGFCVAVWENGMPAKVVTLPDASIMRITRLPVSAM
ncbi:hypothetical protein D3C86_1799850 [compost metagenome]